MSNKQKSSQVACFRLKNVLHEDRAQMSVDKMDLLKKDLIKVMAAYTQVREDSVNLYVLRGPTDKETKLIFEAIVQTKRGVCTSESAPAEAVQC